MSNGYPSRWHEIYTKLETNPDELEIWEDLVDYVESDKFGLSKGSDETVVKLFRFTFDGLLEKYPLLFGYWVRYSNVEFQLGNTELALKVFERGVSACPYSVDLWVEYCQFCIEIYVRDPSRVRLIFERAIELVGGHFLSHSLWDLYLNYEEKIMESPKELIYKILGHIVSLPIHQYSKYFARYRGLTPNVSVELTAPKEVIEQYKAEYEIELEEESSTLREVGGEGGAMDEDVDLYGDEGSGDSGNLPRPTGPAADRKPVSYLKTPEADLRIRIGDYQRELYRKTQVEVTKRFQYESQINRHYFHIAYLDEAQRVNWNNYLNFEEAEGDDEKIILLYERALIPAGHSETLWFRYVRWLIGKSKVNDAINVLHRACMIVPIGRPEIRYYFATLLSSNGLYFEARIMLESILQNLPSSIKASNLLTSIIIKSEGVDKAIEYLNHLLEPIDSTIDINYQVELIKQLTDLYSKTGRIAESRLLFEKYSTIYSQSTEFWKYYLEFEISHSADTDFPSTILLSIQTSGLDKSQIKPLTQIYMAYLLNSCTKTSAVSEFIRLDRSISKLA